MAMIPSLRDWREIPISYFSELRALMVSKQHVEIYQENPSKPK